MQGLSRCHRWAGVQWAYGHTIKQVYAGYCRTFYSSSAASTGWLRSYVCCFLYFLHVHNLFKATLSFHVVASLPFPTHQLALLRTALSLSHTSSASSDTLFPFDAPGHIQVAGLALYLDIPVSPRARPVAFLLSRPTLFLSTSTDLFRAALML